MAKTKQTAAIVKAAQPAATLAHPMEDWERQLMDEAKAAVAKETAGIPRISKKGAQFMIDGNILKVPSLRVVVIDYIFTHTYFEKKYVEGQSGTPDCYAYGTQDDGMVPLANVRDRQCETCDACPHNVFKTAENGKGKRCPGGRKLAVIMPNDDPDSLAKAEMRILTANSGSLKNWGAYMRAVADVSPSGHPISVLTEVTIEPLGGVYIFAFKAVERLDSAQVKALLPLRERAHAALVQPWPDIETPEPAAPAPRRKVKGQ